MSNRTNIYLTCQDSSDIADSINYADELGYCGIITPVVSSDYFREFINESLAVKHQWFTRSPLLLSSDKWITKVVPSITPRNLATEDEELKLQYEKEFMQELSFARHLKGDAGFIKVLLTGSEPEQLAKLLLPALNNHTAFNQEIYAEISMDDKAATSADNYYQDYEETDPCVDQWAVWNKFHGALGESSSRVRVALKLTANLPSDEEIQRWIGEKIGLLIIPHYCFINNKFNCSVLPLHHKKVVKWIMQYTGCQIAIEACGSDSDMRIKSYSDNIAQFCNIETAHADFADHLRYPLQPLYDNLDTGTYETFESDPAKYKRYQQAIEAAITDKVPEAEIKYKRLILIVLGAGRGPLVRAAINASKNTGRKLKIIVVEKNPNAIVTLSSMINVLWPKEDITLLAKDMRDIVLEEKADLIVSELLGSFGDNELSPECLDGIQSLLKDDGLSIPCNSVSYLRPIFSRNLDDKVFQRLSEISSNQLKTTMYSVLKEVGWVNLHYNVYYIDEPKEFATFVHPNTSTEVGYNCHKILPFTAKLDCVLHGFAGYFTSKLYKNIEISILPKTHTQGMNSWYPYFLPLSDGGLIKKGENISCEIWRKTDPKKVWYEWRANGGKLHNQNGEIHPIYLDMTK